jgi:hypothetical protein
MPTGRAISWFAVPDAVTSLSFSPTGDFLATTHVGSLVRFFFSRQKFTLEDAIGSHACSLEANKRATNGIPLGCPLLLPVGTVNCVQTLKGVFLWANRSLFGAVSLTPLNEKSEAPEVLLLPKTSGRSAVAYTAVDAKAGASADGEDAEDAEEGEEEGEDAAGADVTSLGSGLVTFSSLPKSRWVSCL